MNIIRNFFSASVASLITIILGLLILSFSITSVIFDTKFVLSTIEKNNTYKVVVKDILPMSLVYALSQRFEEANPDQAIAQKITDKLDKSTFSNLEPDIKKIVEDSYSFVIGEKDKFEVRIELKKYIRPLQQNLVSAVTSLQNEGQLQGLDSNQLSADLQEANEASIYLTQDKIEVSGLKEINQEANNKTREEGSFLTETRLALERLRQTQSLLIAATIILFLSLFLTRIPHWLTGIKWISTTLISGSAFPLVVSLLLFFVKPVGLISNFLKKQESFMTFSSAVNLMTVNLGEITEKIFFNAAIISAGLLGLGIILYLVISFFIGKSSHPHKS